MVRYAIAMVVSVLAGLPSAAACPGSAKAVVRQVELQGPMVVAFLPSSLQGSGADASSALRFATKALGRVKSCLGPQAAAYRLVYADRIVVRDGEHEETFEVAQGGHLPGALLLSPDTNSRIVYAGGGPQALVPLLRQAASDYFGAACPS